jgi:hypothetical protein
VNPTHRRESPRNSLWLSERVNGSTKPGRKLRFKTRSPGTNLLIQQMRDFPVADHDDGPDALEMALRLMIELWNGRANKGPSATVLKPW